MSDEFQSKRFEVEILYDPGSDRIVGERWRDQHGRFDRAGDLPAYVDYCPETGTATYARWHKEGKLHRDGDKPATIVTRSGTGTVICEQYAVLGHVHREGDRPAHIERDDRGRLQEQRFYRYGELHRDSGAAVERFSVTTGRPKSVEFWRNGQRRELLDAFPAPALE